ncbi:MAG TPA: TetR/AcrR family transcriptional regulator [Gemmatimonadales bacterium]|nr:TetR/AcrR family transcriptional regulator [Gemmatimonadales bacterium]
MPTKGQRTRSAILEHATGLASQLGLTGLTIGHLADELRLSKSGLFAHFRSKEALQIQVLDHAAAKFVDQVVRPSLREPRGEPRLRALFERWLAWDAAQSLPGGCVFAQAASELDDRAGPVRDRLVRLQREWIGVLVTSVGLGVAAGRFRPDADAEQFAQDLYGVMLAFHHAWRLLTDPQAEARARRAFGALLDGIRQTTGDPEDRP